MLLKLFKWIWRKAEEKTADDIMRIVDKFFLSPDQISISDPSYKTVKNEWLMSRKLLDDIHARYYPEPEPIASKTVDKKTSTEIWEDKSDEV